MLFRYTCTQASEPKRLQELLFIIDHARKITYETFRRRIGGLGIATINARHGYGVVPKHIKDDRYVSFYRSKLPDGRPVYYYDWSRIEHVYY